MAEDLIERDHMVILDSHLADWMVGINPDQADSIERQGLTYALCFTCSTFRIMQVFGPLMKEIEECSDR